MKTTTNCSGSPVRAWRDAIHSLVRRACIGNVIAFATVGVVLGAGVTSAADDIEYSRDIRPILSDRCNFCHGPDVENRQAGLRLDRREDAVDVLESGDLLERINSDDPDMQMPPPESKLSLTSKEKDLLKRWIDRGAEYQSHWAFELLPESVEAAKPKDSSWAHQPMDGFVRAKMEAEGLKPNDEAVPLRWLRRVTFDLTGLPPTAVQISEFQKRLAADAETAYESTADELLQSSGFGEHMAVAWLDLARYADSYGYQSDKLNTQWPYRDWVVQALNENLPYDDFLTWQLAGDLLPVPTRDQKLATAFNRIHRLNNEGGAVFEEWRIENVADRVHTFGTAVLGLTMECCRCHDHKYDPIPMREYYSLSAFFNTIDESGVYDRTQKVPCPSMLLPTEDQTRALESAKHAVEVAEQAYHRELERVEELGSWELPKQVPDLRLGLAFDRDFDNSIKDIYHPSQNDRSWTSMSDLVEVSDSPLPRLPADLARDQPKKEESENAKVKKDDVKAETLAEAQTGEPSKEPTFPRRAIKLDGERGVTAHGIEPIDRWTPFTVAISMRETRRVPDRSLIVHHTRGTDCGYNGWDLTLVDGHVESRMYRVWPGNAIGVRTVDPIPLDVWHQLSATYDGSSTAAGLKLFLNGELLKTEVLRDEMKKSANVKVDHGGDFVIGQRFRARGLAGGLIDDIQLYDRNLSTLELQYLATGEWGEPTAEALASAVDTECRAALAKLTDARKAMVMAEEVMDEVPIMREDTEPRETHVLARGQYDAETNADTRVTREVLTSLPLPFPKDQPRDRMGLARWVTDPNHPLTARVAVNRLWGNFFADPLVRTPENFGLQGELPTHPGLLDWLARDFIDSGWDVKRLCKNIVLSSTYRQDSVVTAESIEKDPTNRFLSRGPAYRLAAEQIRDLALVASGLMNHERGGPPVSPYQPGGDLWRESNGMSPPYEQSVGRSLYRRSLYSVWKRTAPLPNMMAFDTTSREVCTVKRSRTNTPLQALVLLNDKQFIEACRKLAEKLLHEESKDEGRVQRAFVLFTGRPVDDAEQKALLELLAAERDWFAEHPEDAAKLLKLGETESAEETDAVQLAALTTVCQAILNLDATIWKR